MPGEAVVPWRIRLDSATVRLSLPHAPQLDRRWRRFITDDVQGADEGEPADFELVTTEAPAPPMPVDVFAVEEMMASWSREAIWVETPAGVLVGADDRYRLHVRPGLSGGAYEPTMALLGHVGARLGWNSLHSALVHSPAGALLLIGQSGKGKSTSSAAALQLGWSVDSDDVTFLRVEDGEVLAMGFPRVLSVPEVAVPDALRQGPQPKLDHRLRRPVRDFARIGGWHRIVAVIEVDHGLEDDTCVADLSPLDVIQGLVRNQAIAGSIPGEDRALATMLRMLATLPARCMALGTDGANRTASTMAALVMLSDERATRALAVSG